MAEYIDKEKLLEKLSRMIDYCKNDNKVNGLTALFQVGDAIIDCPTVVMCGECKHSQKQDEVFGVTDYKCSKHNISCLSSCDFCSYGERKDT